jgi:hypothetical protein
MRAPKMSARADERFWISAAIVLIAAAGLLSRAARPGVKMTYYGESSIEIKTTRPPVRRYPDIRITSEEHCGADLYSEQTGAAGTAQRQRRHDWSNDRRQRVPFRWIKHAKAGVMVRRMGKMMETISWSFPNTL